jgi:hypothetical protein
MNEEQAYLKRKYVRHGYFARLAYARGFYFDDDKGIYVKINRTECSVICKRLSNRKLRKTSSDIANHSGYRKTSRNWMRDY